ncbi:MAG: hypothetical protein IKZ43_04655 [Acidaminococcaceae bacterium]|nr:hypothetical protein [Acidaminococcaceae bacterium]
MNKIYKVIWSKAKHCYVVTSELAKRNTKGCGTRSLRMAAVTLGVTAALVGGAGFGSPLAYADGSITISNANDPMGTATGGTVTTSSGYVYPKDPSIHELNVVGGKTGNYYFAGYYSSSASDPVSGYILNISGSNTQIGIGQYSGQTDGVYIGSGLCTASGNKVNVTDGAVAIGEMAGAKIAYGTAENNEITIKDSVARHTVIGGYFTSNTSSGVAIGNTVTVSGIKEGESYTVAKVVYGGGGKIGTAGVKVVHGNEVQKGNKVFIKDGSVIGDGTSNGGYVYGGSVEQGSGAVKYNSVEIEGSTVKRDVYGGYTGGSGVAGNNTVTISAGATVEGSVYGGYSNSSSGAAEVEGNTVTVVNSYAGIVYGGRSGSNGSVKNNTVNISGRKEGKNYTVQRVYGGYSQSGSAGGANEDEKDLGNKVIVNGINTVLSSDVFGGYVGSGTGAANYNSVDISGGTVGSSVYGGYVNSEGNGSETGDVNYNQVTIKDTQLNYNSSEVYGGRASSGTTKGNKVTINNIAIRRLYGGDTSWSGDAIENIVTVENSTVLLEVYGGRASHGTAKGNTVTISGIKDGQERTVHGGVYGGYSYDGSAGGTTSEDRNKVIISGDNTVVGASSGVYGGYVERGTGSANYNSVDFSDGKVINGVVGGFSYGGDASYNTVDFSGGTSDSGVFGGYSYYGSGSADGNTVTISNGATINSVVLGGMVSSGTGSASGNTVTVADSSVGKDGYGYSVTGGYSSAGNANNNHVVISNSTVPGAVRGGYANGGAGSAIGNTVVTSGGTIHGIEGGGTFITTGKVENNTVIINDSTVDGSISGGRGYEKTIGLSGNAVIINGGSINTTYVYGGLAGNSSLNGATDVIDNTVVIAGGTVTANINIYGGYANKNRSANNNKIDLTGTVTGLSGATLYGGSSDYDSYSGNELHIGRNVTYDSDGNAVRGTDGKLEYVSNGNTIWQGKTGDAVDNKVKKLANFATIALHSVAWDTATPVLEANTLSSAGMTLDITDMKLYTDASGSSLKTLTNGDTMALVKSGIILGSVKLKYKDGEEIKTTTGSIGTGVSFDNKEYSEPAVNGVKLTGNEGKTIKLIDNNKTIQFSYGNSVTGLSFDSTQPITFSATTPARDLEGTYTFDSTSTINATDLAFADTTTALKKNDSMTLVANATGITADHTVTQPGEGKGTIGINYTDTGTGIAYEATAGGNVTADTNAVKYTVNSVTVGKITLASQAWGTTAEMPDDSWTASSSTQIYDTGFAYTGTASTALKANDTATILNAPGLTTASPVTDGAAGKTVDVNYSDEAGVTYTATASGHVAAAKDAVNYVVDSVEATGVNLQNWDGTDTSTAITTVGWTGTGVAVDTGTFTAPTDMKLGETRTIASAATGFFGAVSGANAHPKDGGTLNEDTGGVKLAGSMIGGVKAEDDGARLTYYAMKKTADTMTLGTFEFVNGNANARTYGLEYDLTNATIITDGLAFTDASKKAMEAGNKMTLVDASGAYKDGGAALKALDAGAKTSFDVEFSDGPIAVTDKSNITVTGMHTDTLAMVDSQRLEYTVGNKVVGTAKLEGTVDWVDNGTHYTNKKYQFDGSSKVDIAGVKFASTTDPQDQSMTLIKNAAGLESANVSGTPDFTVALSNTTLTATAAGNVSMDSSNLKYTVTAVTLDKVAVDAVGSDAVPEGWNAAADVQIDTDTMTVPAEVTYGNPQNILTADSAIFTDDNITGKNKYGVTPAVFTDTDNKSTPAVTIAGTQDKGVRASADGRSLVYEAGKKEASSIVFGSMRWAAGSVLMDGSSNEYDYSAVSKFDTSSFSVTFDAPEKVDAGKGESVTLLKANETLSDMAEQTKKSSYRYNPVSGVTVKAAITGTLTTSGGVVTYTPTANQASKLTFGDVKWDQSKPLMTRPANITFAGADVDTAKINFVNMTYLDANQKMTLVSNFGDSVGTITGSKYMVGTAFEGEGKASLSGSNLIFTTKTEAGLSEQTHKTVMAMDTGLAMLNTGNEFVGKTIAGLADNANKGSDGISTFASVGGGTSRYSTGSHVNTHTWNAVVGVGKTNETKKGAMEYGIFGEYGKGSYTLHSDAGDGDGDAHYAGGGLLAKWTNKHDVYAEASIRAGRMSDSSSDIMQDGLGNKYGYNVHANYYGAHIGAGKIFNYKGGKSLDVYGKFFYTKRDGVEYDAVQHYNLDSVASSILRIGARYGTTDKKWNWYGGLAYEYEFDGEATGTVNGKEIRAASIKGSSVRGELGMRMNATKDNPWQADISVYGYGGKHRGFGGNVNVAYTF